MLSSVDSDDLDMSEKMDTGKYIAMARVIIQLIAFGIFSVAAVRFNFTFKLFSSPINERFETSGKKTYHVDGVVKKKHWPALVRVTNFSTLMILVRSIYRLVEFTEGNPGYTNTYS